MTVRYSVVQQIVQNIALVRAGETEPVTRPFLFYSEPIIEAEHADTVTKFMLANRDNREQHAYFMVRQDDGRLYSRTEWLREFGGTEPMERFYVNFGPTHAAEMNTRLGEGWHKHSIDSRHYMGENWNAYRLADGRIAHVSHGFAYSGVSVYADAGIWQAARRKSDEMMPDPETGRRPALYKQNQ